MHLADHVGVSNDTFSLGKPVSSCAREPRGTYAALILGAYPSALHVHWTPAGDARAIQAFPVDNEPEPFWRGGDELEHVVAWRDEFFDDRWGSVKVGNRF